MSIKNIFIFTLAVTLFLLSQPGLSRAKEAAIGFIKKAEAPAYIIRKTVSSDATPGSPVFAMDVLKTGENGSIGVRFNDDTVISLGADTEFSVEEYMFQPKDNSVSFISRMTQGTLHYISGAIGKLSPSSVSVKTPTGTIGIRGTRFLLKVDPE